MERAKWLMDQNRYAKAFKAAKKGYSLYNEDKQFEKIIPYLVIDNVFRNIDDSDDEAVFDSLVKQQIVAFPFLETSYEFRQFLFISQVYIAENYFVSNNIEKGLVNLEKLETYLTDQELAEEPEVKSALGELYGTITAYYFRHKNFEEALKWVEEGLKMVPKSESLQRKKTYILEELEDN